MATTTPVTCRVTDIPARDRPRERLGRVGVGALTDAELIALVIRSGAAEVNALDVGRELLAGHDGIKGLSVASVTDLVDHAGMGAAKASALVAAFELGRRASASAGGSPLRLSSAADIARAAMREIDDPRREQSLAVILSSKNRLLKIERLTTGTEDRCLIDPRDVLRVVLATRGTRFAVVHSHPSGDPSPSAEDVIATRALEAAASATGLTFVDHIVVAGRRWASVRTATDPGVEPTL